MKSAAKFTISYMEGGKYEFVEKNSRKEAIKLYRLLKAHKMIAYIERNGKK